MPKMQIRNNNNGTSTVTLISTPTTLMCEECFHIVDVHSFESVITMAGEYMDIFKNSIHIPSLQYLGTSDPSGKLCPNCDNSSMVGIDTAIIKHIIQLNKAGIKTAYCCAGHMDDNLNTVESGGYIMLDGLYKVQKDAYMSSTKTLITNHNDMYCDSMFTFDTDEPYSKLTLRWGGCFNEIIDKTLSAICDAIVESNEKWKVDTRYDLRMKLRTDLHESGISRPSNRLGIGEATLAHILLGSIPCKNYVTMEDIGVMLDKHPSEYFHNYEELKMTNESKISEYNKEFYANKLRDIRVERRMTTYELSKLLCKTKTDMENLISCRLGPNGADIKNMVQILEMKPEELYPNYEEILINDRVRAYACTISTMIKEALKRRKISQMVLIKKLNKKYPSMVLKPAKLSHALKYYGRAEPQLYLKICEVLKIDISRYIER